MKKITALIICLLLAASCALAELPQLSKYSDSEILKLLTMVQGEVVARKLEKTATLKSGKYIAGEDIPAGKYILTCTYKGDWYANITIYSDRGNGKQKMWEVVTGDEGEFSKMVTLEKGDQLSNSYEFKLTVYTGPAFR